MFAFSLFALLFALPSTPPAPSPADAAAAAQKAVDANMAEPTGPEFDMAVGVHFGRNHLETMTRCTKSRARSDRLPFDIYLYLRTDGRVSRLVSNPRTSLAACIEKALSREVFPAPPHDHYWVQLHIEVDH